MLRKQYNSKFKRVFISTKVLPCIVTIETGTILFAYEVVLFLRFHRISLQCQNDNALSLSTPKGGHPPLPTKHKNQWRFSFWHFACAAFRPDANFTWIINFMEALTLFINKGLIHYMYTHKYFGQNILNSILIENGII